MTRQTTSVQINSFVRGLITEASPLTFPENASLDEDNFVLMRDGSRRRRLGMDYEPNFEQLQSNLTPNSETEAVFSSYTWKNPGGYASRSIAVLQMGDQIHFHDIDVAPLSSERLYTRALGRGDSIFSYATVDGILVVVNGEGNIHLFEYDGTNVSYSTDRLKIRDQFGVEDIYNGRNLREGLGVSYRPPQLTDEHKYNLRNQTWAQPRTAKAGDDYERREGDTIQAFFDRNGYTSPQSYPSNADAVTYSIGAAVDDDGILDDADSFLPDDLVQNPPGSFVAPQGYFIIDALNRGSSRLEQVQQLQSDNPQLIHRVFDLAEDRSPDGATSVGEYAGRIWYGGFTSRVIDGDSLSPRLASYVFYSKLVQDPTDITKCYQVGDPTSEDAPDLLDTDGGFIRIDGAYNILSLVNVGSALIVLAENGIWMISGGSDYGFSANNNMRRKISENGVGSTSSVVVVENTVFFWADDAIYQIGPDQFGEYQSQNITTQTIQTFYDSISPVDKLYAQGSYDSYERKVRWIFQNRLLSPEDSSRELIFDMNLGAFYTNTFGRFEGRSPRAVSAFEVSPYRLESIQNQVVADSVDVQVNGENVYVEQSLRGEGTRELYYLTITNLDPITYTFSYFRDESFVDWYSYNNEGLDAEAFLITGYLSGGDFMRYKQAPYIYFYFNRTEDGFEDVNGDLFPLHPSGCLVQSQWEWANSAASNRWGRTFQAYRYKRPYFAFSSADEYDTGFGVIETRNKLRGKGKVLSLKINTEPGKDCQLLGWSMMIGVTGNV